jgi:hypothetical protein
MSLSAPKEGYARYEADKVLDGLAQEFVHATRGFSNGCEKTKAPTQEAMISQLASACNYILGHMDKNSLVKRNRAWTLSDFSHNLAGICKYEALNTYETKYEALHLGADAFFAIVSKIKSKHKTEMLLLMLSELIPEKDGKLSEHECMAYLDRFLSLGLTKEDIRDYAMITGHVPLLETGLLSHDFFAGVTHNPAYPKATLTFLQKNKLLAARPVLEWQTAIAGDHDKFTSGYNPSTEELAELLQQAVENRVSEAWEWFIPTLSNPLTPVSSKVVWVNFLEEALRNQPPSKLKAKFFAVLDICDLPEATLRKDLEKLFVGLNRDKAADLALRLGFLRLGGKALASYMPEASLMPLVEMVLRNRQAGQAGHILTTIVLLQPAISHKPLERLTNGKGICLWGQENHQILLTILGT